MQAVQILAPGDNSFIKPPNARLTMMSVVPTGHPLSRAVKSRYAAWSTISRSGVLLELVAFARSHPPP
jgi:hypothetical protein